MSIQPLNNNSGQAYIPAAPNATVPGTTVKAPSLPLPAEPAQTVQSSATASEQKDALHAAAQKANQAILGLGSDLRFSVDKDTGIEVVKFVDDKTKEVIRQIPAQEMLDIAKRLDELKGLLIKERA